MRPGGVDPQNGPYSCPAVEILLRGKQTKKKHRDVDSLNTWLSDVQPNVNMQEPHSISPKEDKSVTDSLHKHEEEYIAYSSSYVY